MFSPNCSLKREKTLCPVYDFLCVHQRVYLVPLFKKVPPQTPTDWVLWPINKNVVYFLFITSVYRAWVGNLKQRVPITSKSSNFKRQKQHYVVKLPKSAGAREYCQKISRVLGTRANSYMPWYTLLQSYMLLIHTYFAVQILHFKKKCLVAAHTYILCGTIFGLTDLFLPHHHSLT